MKHNLPSKQLSKTQIFIQPKKTWVKPEIVRIDILSGNTPLGPEGVHTFLYNGITFTGVYFS